MRLLAALVPLLAALTACAPPNQTFAYKVPAGTVLRYRTELSTRYGGVQVQATGAAGEALPASTARLLASGLKSALERQGASAQPSVRLTVRQSSDTGATVDAVANTPSAVWSGTLTYGPQGALEVVGAGGTDDARLGAALRPVLEQVGAGFYGVAYAQGQTREQRLERSLLALPETNTAEEQTLRVSTTYKGKSVDRHFFEQALSSDPATFSVPSSASGQVEVALGASSGKGTVFLGEDGRLIEYASNLTTPLTLTVTRPGEFRLTATLNAEQTVKQTLEP